MTREHDLTFPSMGSEARVVLRGPAAVLDDARWWLGDYEARLSRFREDSELSRLNADPREIVPASGLLRAAVRAARWAAERSGGLVDPTLLDALERAGYADSRAGCAPASLEEAFASAPARRPARPDPRAAWRALEVDAAARTVRRPCGLRVDNGGTGKGLAADALAHRLRAQMRFAVDCGGDIRVGGADPRCAPFPVEIAHPLTGECAHRIELAGGAIASSGLDVRIWRTGDGGFAHHLLDPRTGEPAWTGLAGASALAGTALEAETLAKTALLSGPEGARRVLTRYGGLLFHEDGGVEAAGPLRTRTAA
jgi:thiamine biosynthesis lipoprotein